MYDRVLVLGILRQIKEALEKIRDRSSRVGSVEELIATPAGQERLDGVVSAENAGCSATYYRTAPGRAASSQPNTANRLTCLRKNVIALK